MWISFSQKQLCEHKVRKTAASSKRGKQTKVMTTKCSCSHCEEERRRVTNGAVVFGCIFIWVTCLLFLCSVLTETIKLHGNCNITNVRHPFPFRMFIVLFRNLTISFQLHLLLCHIHQDKNISTIFVKSMTSVFFCYLLRKESKCTLKKLLLDTQTYISIYFTC